jgi:intraflagellar transport protein 81
VLILHCICRHQSILLNSLTIQVIFCKIAIVELSKEIGNLQEDFKSLHKAFDGLSKGINANTIKREIQQLEEEKQQVSSRIMRMKQKVQGITDRETWLELAKQLRLEQNKEMEISKKQAEQNGQLLAASQKLELCQKTLKQLSVNISDVGDC